MADTDRSTPRRKGRKWMPRMQGAAVQCCMCIVGVFLFLGGLIMLVTGVCLILNYGIFDENLLPPDLQNDEGKKTIGIVLTCCGLFAILISVVASALYLCTKSKPSSINPNELSRIPNTARNTPPDRSGQRRGDRNSIPSINGNPRAQPSKVRTPNTKSIPGSTEVIHTRQPGHRKGRTRGKMKHRGRRLEEIKEQDAISRKTIEGAALAESYDDSNLTPRSGSFSSQLTLDESRNPRIVIGAEEPIRPPSTDSASTSHLSDISNFRTLENDKSRRELQFVPDSIKYSNNSQYDTVSKDSISLTKENEVIAYRRDSEEGSITSDNKHQMSTSSFNSFNDKFSAGGNDFTAQGRLPDVSSSDESSIGYKASNFPDFHSDKTSGVKQQLSSDSDTQTKTEIKPFNAGDTYDVQKDNGSHISAENSDKLATASEVTLLTSYKQGITNEGFDSKPNDDSFV